MLLGSLYTINNLQSLENSTILAQIKINPEHSVFKGHFPNHPVMPGVCLTNIVTDTVSLFFNKSYYLASADFIKFIQLVIPEKTSTMAVTFKILQKEGEVLRIESSLSDEASVYLKLKGNFNPLIETL